MIEVCIKNKLFDFSITFAELKKLRCSDEAHYRDFFDCYGVNDKDFTDKALLIYIAYLCANMNNPDALSEDDFYSLLEENITLIDVLYNKIYYSKINSSFAKAFIKKTRKYDTKIKLPKFELCDLEDYYSYFVLLNKIPIDTFWNEQIPFVEAVATNKNAVDGFMNYQQHKLLNQRK